MTSLVTSVTAARRAGLCPTCTKGVMMAILSDRGEDTTGWIKLACLCARVPGPESEIQGLYHSSWGNSQLCQSLHERSPFTFVCSVFHEECRPPDPLPPPSTQGQAKPCRAAAGQAVRVCGPKSSREHEASEPGRPGGLVGHTAVRGGRKRDLHVSLFLCSASPDSQEVQVDCLLLSNPRPCVASLPAQGPGQGSGEGPGHGSEPQLAPPVKDSRKDEGSEGGRSVKSVTIINTITAMQQTTG